MKAALLLASALLGAVPSFAGTLDPEPIPIFQAYPVKKVRGLLLYGGNRPKKLKGVVEGTLELATVPHPAMDGRVILDRAAFATCPKGQKEPTPGDATLVIEIPGSVLYADVYAAATIMQLGDNIRTHWALLYSQPGTTFTLDVTVSCIDKQTGQPVEHLDRHAWEVVATFESVRALLDALHRRALGTSQIPPIVSERRYAELLAAVGEIEGLVEAGFTMTAKSRIADLQTSILDEIAGMGPLGVLTTTENPAGPALGVALEYIDAQL